MERRFDALMRWFIRCVHIDRGAHNFFGLVAGGHLEMLLVAHHAVAVAVSGEAHVHQLRATREDLFHNCISVDLTPSSLKRGQNLTRTAALALHTIQ